MKTTLTVINTRRKCAKALKIASTDKHFAVITNVKLTRLAFRTWHLEATLAQGIDL